MTHKNPFDQLFDPNFYNTIETVVLGADKFFSSLQDIHSFSTGYPPASVQRVGKDDYRIELAVAGFKKDEITVKVEKHPDRRLVITGEKPEKDGNGDFIQRGIAQRSFTWMRGLDETLRIESVSLEDGILSVDIKHEIPEEKKPETYDIK